MAAIKRALLPWILKTVKWLTLSALVKVCRSSANELNSVRLTIRYQDSSAAAQSGRFFANSSKRFRVIMCMQEIYLILRWLSIRKNFVLKSLNYSKGESAALQNQIFQNY
jgi:hypothetical protein